MRVLPVSRSKMSKFVSVGLFALVVMVFAVAPAFAQTASPTPPPVGGIVDYDAMTLATKAELSNAVNKFIPLVVLVFASLLGVALLFKWVKKGAKTS